MGTTDPVSSVNTPSLWLRLPPSTASVACWQVASRSPAAQANRARCSPTLRATSLPYRRSASSSSRAASPASLRAAHSTAALTIWTALPSQCRRSAPTTANEPTTRGTRRACPCEYPRMRSTRPAVRRTTTNPWPGCGWAPRLVVLIVRNLLKTSVYGHPPGLQFHAPDGHVRRQPVHENRRATVAKVSDAVVGHGRGSTRVDAGGAAKHATSVQPRYNFRDISAGLVARSGRAVSNADPLAVRGPDPARSSESTQILGPNRTRATGSVTRYGTVRRSGSRSRNARNNR